MKFRKSEKSDHVIDILFSLALFVFFAMIGISVVLVGSRVYQSTVSHMEENYTSRTALAYVSEKVRQSDASGAVELSTPEGFDEPALTLHQSLNETDYDTYIYFYDGSLRELLVKAGTPVTPEQGTAIVSLSSFEIEKSADALYILTAVDHNGEKNRLMIHPNSSR